MRNITNTFFISSVLFVIKCECCFTKSEMDVLVDLIKHLNVDHCILVVDGCHSIYQTSILIKRLFKNKIFVTCLKIEQLAKELNSKYFPDYDTVIILKGEGSKTMQHFVQKGVNKRINSFFKWIFLTNLTSSEAFNEKEVFIPYDCQFLWVQLEGISGDYSMRELYQFREDSETKTFEFGKWHAKDGLSVTNFDFYSTRKNFQNFSFIAVRALENHCRYPVGCLHDQILNDFRFIFNLTYENYSVAEIQNLGLKTDIEVGGAVFSADDSNLNLIAPTFPVTMLMFMKADYGESRDSWHRFLRPFSFNMWSLIMLWIIISAVSFIFLFYLPEKKKKYTVIDYFLISLDALCNQEGKRISADFSTRILSITSRICACILISSYSAAIVALLLIRIPKLPFSDLEGFIQDGTYKFFTIRGAYGEIYFMNKSNPYYHSVGLTLMVPTEDHVLTFPQGADVLCSNKSRIFLGYNTHFLNIPARCTILKLPSKILQVLSGIPLAEKSPFKTVLNKEMTKYRESGVLEKMEQHLHSRKKGVERENVLKPITLHHSFIIFLILPFGIFLSLVIWSFERLINHQSKRNSTCINTDNEYYIR